MNISLFAPTCIYACLHHNEYLLVCIDMHICLFADPVSMASVIVVVMVLLVLFVVLVVVLLYSYKTEKLCFKGEQGPVIVDLASKVSLAQ